jgi:hypothetical protein
LQEFASGKNAAGASQGGPILLANCQREVRLAACRRLLLVSNVAAAMPSTDAASLAPAQPRCRPQCGGSRLVYRALQPADVTLRVPAQDSS